MPGNIRRSEQYLGQSELSSDLDDQRHFLDIFMEETDVT